VSGFSTTGGGLAPLPPELDPRGRARRATSGTGPGGRRTSGLGRALLSLCTIASILLLLLYTIVWWKYRAFNEHLNKLSIAGLQHGKDLNLLVVGNDDRSDATDAELAALGTTRDGGSLNTDTMMIIHVPASGAKATLISLPRDSWVKVPGYGMGKLNSAYPDAYNAASGSLNDKRTAGAKLLVQTVHNLTGLTIDHFVSVDLLGFYRISNAIGGIRVNMCNAVQDSYSGINLHQGVNVIEGTQALAFVRQRHGLALSDLDRVKRQQYFLTASFRKITTAGVLLNPFKLQRLLNAVSSSLYMDSTLNPLSLARQVENLSANNIVGKTIPTTNGTLDDGTSILSVDPAQVKTFIAGVLGGDDTKLSAATPASPATVTVDVLNGGTVNGAAAVSAAALHKAGFGIGQVGSASTSAANTTIEYSSGQEAAARAVKIYVPGAIFLKVDGLSHVTLLLGADGMHALSARPTASAPAKTPKPAAIDAGCIN
jgi:LCP family protein required for cell wall assembly